MSGIHRIVRSKKGGLTQPTNADLKKESVGPAAPEKTVVTPKK
jgi:hypothetical protein